MASSGPESSGPRVDERDLQITSSSASGRLAQNENVQSDDVGRVTEYNSGISEM
jgi:hypothetical protein